MSRQSEWTLTYTPGNDQGVSWEEFKLVVRGVFQQFAAKQFDEAQQTCKLTLNYMIGRKRLEAKLGDLNCYTSHQKVPGFTDAEDATFATLMQKYGLNPPRKEPSEIDPEDIVEEIDYKDYAEDTVPDSQVAPVRRTQLDRVGGQKRRGGLQRPTPYARNRT